MMPVIKWKSELKLTNSFILAKERFGENWNKLFLLYFYTFGNVKVGTNKIAFISPMLEN